jgi:hypothetical protein
MFIPFKEDAIPWFASRGYINPLEWVCRRMNGVNACEAKMRGDPNGTKLSTLQTRTNGPPQASPGQSEERAAAWVTLPNVQAPKGRTNLSAATAIRPK